MSRKPKPPPVPNGTLYAWTRPATPVEIETLERMYFGPHGVSCGGWCKDWFRPKYHFRRLWDAKDWLAGNKIMHIELFIYGARDPVAAQLVLELPAPATPQKKRGRPRKNTRSD